MTEFGYVGAVQLCTVCGAHSKIYNNRVIIIDDGWLLMEYCSLCPDCATALKELIRQQRSNSNTTIEG